MVPIDKHMKNQKQEMFTKLVHGWTNPSEKYAQVKMGENLPQVSGWK